MTEPTSEALESSEPQAFHKSDCEYVQMRFNGHCTCGFRTPQPTTEAKVSTKSGAETLINLLTKAVGDIAAALSMASKDQLIARWTAPYVAAINAFDPPQPTTDAHSAALGDYMFRQSDIDAVKAGATVSTQGLTLIATEELTRLRIELEKYECAAPMEGCMSGWEEVVPGDQSDALVEELARDAYAENPMRALTPHIMDLLRTDDPQTPVPYDFVLEHGGSHDGLLTMARCFVNLLAQREAAVFEVGKTAERKEGAAGISAHEIASTIIQDVAELPDRDSPNDWSDAMLVTAEELRLIVVRAIDAAIQSNLHRSK